ncbi:MAG: hypothetical protein ABIP34_07990 [Rhodoferax sp.]|uniref:hypothetical protein n=1 Tax=Rhodoferax sp. TaxID=50421 RepID=UPI003266A721
MSINPVSSQVSIAIHPKTQSVESGESVSAGKEVRNDGDSDDRGASVSQAAARQPITNALGELIGQHVNVKV